MKIIRFISVLIIFISVFASCSTDVDMYAEYKDVAIIYAMLNPRVDTNYVKVTRAFCGTNDNPINANEAALISDSSNYEDKLDVSLFELKSSNGGYFVPTGRVLVLDTLTIHNKEEGVFYAPDQLVYYTAEQINTGSGEDKYGYRLYVVKPNGDTVTARTTVVGNEDFDIITSSVSFQIAHSNAMSRILFRADGVATVYAIRMQFNYLEEHNGQGMKLKNVSRSFGTRPLSSYEKVENTENVYYQEYTVNWLFEALADAIGGDTIVNLNHPNVVRYFDSFVMTISAAGNELYEYSAANQAQNNAPVSLITPFTNIEGGYGLFSSRTTIEKEAKLSTSCKRDLYGKASWGFKEH